MPLQSLLENLAKRARRAINEARRSGSASADPSVSARLDRSGEKKSALIYLLDYIVRTDTISKKRGKEVKMDSFDFPMDFVGGNEPPLSEQQEDFIENFNVFDYDALRSDFEKLGKI